VLATRRRTKIIKIQTVNVVGSNPPATTSYPYGSGSSTDLVSFQSNPNGNGCISISYPGNKYWSLPYPDQPSTTASNGGVNYIHLNSSTLSDIYLWQAWNKTS